MRSVALAALLMFAAPCQAEAPTGYLPPGALDPRAIAGEPPAPGGPVEAADRAYWRQRAALAHTDRWRLAQADAEIEAPYALQAFDCALSARLAEADAPALRRLFERTLLDAAALYEPLRDATPRARPLSVDPDAPVCVRRRPELETAGAWPSGHAIAGQTWAMILAELAPDQAEAVLARGRAYGESRAVCGVHWRSDVEAGRKLGAALFARLQSEPAFRADMELARLELRMARAQGLTNPVCTAERRALASGP